MAHSPKVKAAAVADLVAGLPQREVAQKYKVGKGTISEWANEVASGQNRAKAQCPETNRGERFKEELERLMVALAAAPRSILERIANGEIETLDADRSEALAALLTAASDTGTRLLQAAAIVLDRPAPRPPELP